MLTGDNRQAEGWRRRLASRSLPIRLDALSANRWFRDRVRVTAHLDRRRREA
jgi:hypothetical protein